MRRWIFGLGLGLLLSGCGEPFFNPVVLCPMRVVALTLTTTPTRPGQPCDLGDYPFSISYAPSVDNMVDPDARAYMLARGKVTVTAAMGAVRLCAGAGQPVCMDGASELTLTLSDSGLLSYQGVFTTENIVLQPGGMFRASLPLVFESFGPGNTCVVDSATDFGCQEPVK